MQLIFIYNAKSGLMNKVMDTLHKTFKPDTYACSLCKITYGSFKMKFAWKTFLEDLPIEQKFYHKNENTPLETEPPCILLKTDEGKLHNLMTSKQLEGITDLYELIDRLKNELEGYAIEMANE